MFTCKIRVGDIGTIDIAEDMFEKRGDLKRPPYFVKTNNGVNCYAVCPQCDNPIQIIGLYQKTEKRKYGRHNKFSIKGLAEYNQAAYDFCPLAHPDKFKTGYPEALKAATDETASGILRTLRENFDGAVSVLQNTTGIYFPDKVLRVMLDEYKGRGGWLYRGASVLNLPWIFAYDIAKTPVTVYGQNGKRACGTLEKRKGLRT